MPREWLQYDMTHMAGTAIFMLSLIFAGCLIRKYGRKYYDVEVFWVPWWLVVALVMGIKFL